MRNLVGRILFTLVVSIIVGSGAWFAVRAISLPVTDASDGEGHGPDQGSREWYGAIAHKTRQREQMAIYSGLAIGGLALPVTFWVFNQSKKSG